MVKLKKIEVHDGFETIGHIGLKNRNDGNEREITFITLGSRELYVHEMETIIKRIECLWVEDLYKLTEDQKHKLYSLLYVD